MPALMTLAGDHVAAPRRPVKHRVTRVPQISRVDLCIYSMSREDADRLATMLAVIPEFREVAADLFGATTVPAVEGNHAS